MCRARHAGYSGHEWNTPKRGTCLVRDPVRSFGADPALVSRHAAAWTRGVQNAGVSACAKHFPGHGDTAQDSHLELPTVDADGDTLARRELPPFVAAIQARAATVMISHIMVPELDAGLPATFSPTILQGLLRQNLGFQGVIVTDALDMKGASEGRGIPAAAALALAGGADLLCIGTNNSDAQLSEICAAIEAAVADGSLPAARLRDAVTRVRALGTHHQLVRRTPVVGIPETVDAFTVATTFAVSDHARDLLAGDRPRVWLRLEPTANIAVGASPWGPWAAGIAPDSTLGPDGDPARFADAVPAGALAIVVGKDNHRQPWALAAIDAVRERADVVAVDMGWPGQSGADIATYGASRLVGAALLELIGR